MNELHKFPSERLCEIIVSFRYLGMLKEEALQAMQILAERRGQGDKFDFEAHIDKLMSELPKINVDINKIMYKLKV